MINVIINVIAVVGMIVLLVVFISCLAGEEQSAE